MDGYLPNKNLIFYSPGTPGVIFSHPANHYISIEQLLDAQEYLVHEINRPVIYIEDRRGNPRHWHKIPTDFLSRAGRF